MNARGFWTRIFWINLRLCGLAAAVGTLAGFGAILFRWFIFWVGDLAYYQTFSRVYLPPSEHALGPWAVVVPAVGGFLVGLITRFFAPETKGHGVPEVMAAVATQDGRIRPRVALAKILASGICIGSGGSAGREGPIVQIGSSLGSALGQFLKLPPGELKVLVGCGAAGGIAATFNAPLAGVIFSVEVILLELRTRSFVPLVIASTMATVVSRAFLGPEPAFSVPPYSLRSPWELLLYLGLGVGAALVGLVETRLLYKFEDLFDDLRIPSPIKAALGGLLLGALALGVPQVLGTGYETVDRILAGGFSPNWELAGYFLVLSLAKILALAITLGSGGSGGVFAPSLFIGVAFGASFGAAVNLLFPEITAPYPAYALVGMAAVFSAASRATLSSIVMLFEMTRNYEIILPLMFACVVADVVAWSISKETIYTLKLSRRGIRLSPEMEINWLRVHTVSDIMRRTVEVVTEDALVAEVRERMARTGHPSFPVVDRKGNLVGIVTHREILRADANVRVGEVAVRNPVVTYPDEPLDVVWEKFRKSGVGRLPVVSRDAPERIVGFVALSDIVARIGWGE